MKELNGVQFAVLFGLANSNTRTKRAYASQIEYNCRQYLVGCSDAVVCPKFLYVWNNKMKWFHKRKFMKHGDKRYEPDIKYVLTPYQIGWFRNVLKHKHLLARKVIII